MKQVGNLPVTVTLNGMQLEYLPCAFGQPVYLSSIYGAAHQVTGVESVEVRTFQRQGVPESTGLDSGRLDMTALEIPRLNNDRNFPEHGRLTITVGGGK